MYVDVHLIGSALREDDLRGRIAVVIDVLRASSTIVTALAHGARAVIPVVDTAQAGKIAANMEPDTFLLGGERQGLKIEGYHLGNSPLEYTPERVKDRFIILNTTNGTALMERAREAEILVVGCFLNAAAVVHFLRQQQRDVLLLCAGQEGRVALEDVLCAGLLTARLWEGKEPPYPTDGARMAFRLYQSFAHHLARAVAESEHARHLRRLGFEADVAYCTHVDVSDIVPVFEDNRLIVGPPVVTISP